MLKEIAFVLQCTSFQHSIRFVQFILPNGSRKRKYDSKAIRKVISLRLEDSEVVGGYSGGDFYEARVTADSDPCR